MDPSSMIDLLKSRGIPLSDEMESRIKQFYTDYAYKHAGHQVDGLNFQGAMVVLSIEIAHMLAKQMVEQGAGFGFVNLDYV